ncbi:uncharacterized protein LOC122055648 isoform X2 [Zingiber officinale]|uniref:Uncharacterized protein n=1 Tax=Zingiber officinale TaxID=94328 RepID=A0A8J5HXV5_ZINOF|nr:uncharacterized protein LOC122055648 isoform X2 [Zingiber officinale]KAG6531995.1 hypothetical protein ZIOFF_005832 [Zingiber officinale]
MAVLVPSVLAMATGDSDNSPSVFLPRLVNGASRLAVSKPSWVVRTASNVRREKMKKPDPPCVVCAGSGRIDCHNCQGRGRTNCLELAMLPKGEWPRWCKVCSGSGLDYCNRCLGTGEYRDIMGFHLRKTKPPQRLGNPMDDHGTARGVHSTGDGS